ncbi:MAG TPA: enoyl-CoA hydratase, partial [Caldimonas sp.]|nr:enoyl-CoA hydratase [Caldimonas sp.]
LAFGLANRVVPAGEARAAAMALAQEIAAFPQACMRHDRLSVKAQSGLPFQAALASEFAFGRRTLASGESVEGAKRFSTGTGRHGSF